MQTRTNEVNGVKYTVHSETGWHVIASRNFYPRVSFKDDPEWDLWWDFGRALIQSTDVEVPFIWPDATDPLEELRIARDKWLDLPADVIRKWTSDLDAVNAAPTDPELAVTTPKNVEGQQ